jgi:hypothetical protein
VIINGKAGVFLNNVIRPALQIIGMWSDGGGELLLGTALHESQGFRYRHQLGGPALSYFQVEPKTHDDIWKNYLVYRKSLSASVTSLLSAPGANKLAELENNDRYAAAIARIRYARVAASLPPAGHLSEQAHFWKSHYNPIRGRGTETQYINDWIRYINMK